MRKARHRESKFSDPARALSGRKLTEALRMVREGRWTIRRAAKFAGITYHEILDRLSELAIDSGPTLQDLEDVLPFLRVKARLGVKDRTRPKMKSPSAAG